MDGEFEKKVDEVVANSFSGLVLVSGHQMGLFEQLNSIPRTSNQIAKSSGCEERYVREWLKIMASSGLIEQNRETNRFWIKKEHINTFMKQSSIMLMSKLLYMVVGVQDKIKNCFRLEGPIGTTYSDYEPYRTSTNISKKSSDDNLIKILPTLPNSVKTSLAGENGAYLDVGCGSGVQTSIVSKMYQTCTCIGIDIEATAIHKASEAYQQENYPNLNFLEMDATRMPERWSNSFDYVTTFDAIHDLAFPDRAIKEIYRVLKPGGIYSMVDVNAHTNVAVNKEISNIRSQILYSVSLFHCMPISLGVENGVGLGTMWGKEKARKMLLQAGFIKIEFHALNDVFGNYHCVCQKPSIAYQKRRDSAFL